MKISEDSIIGEIVSADYRLAAVFQSYGIDFCCHGNRTIKAAGDNEGLPIGKIVEDLNEFGKRQDDGAIDFRSWPIDLLADYVEKKHHRYVEDKTILLKQYLDKICSVHGANHPELHEIRKEFAEGAGELAAHMKKEELIIFPFIRKMVNGKSTDWPVGASHFGTIGNPIAMMMDDHEAEGERYRRISALSNGYKAPADGCNTYKVTFAMLKEFEQDLHLHIHLENNILFPRAIEMENTMNSSCKV